MPPRRGARGRGRGSFQNQSFEENDRVIMQQEQLQSVLTGEGNDAQNDASCEAQNEVPAGVFDSLTKKESQIEAEGEKNSQSENETTNGNPEVEVKPQNTAENVPDYPYKVKVSHLPAVYTTTELLNYLWSTFNLKVPKIIPSVKNSPWLLLCFENKEQQENCIISLHNHIWKKKALRAIAFYGPAGQKHPLEGGDEGPDGKKLKLDDILSLSLEEEILSESLPLYNVPYEEQNRLTIQDVQLLSNKLHAFMCVRNPALAGWAEAMKENNDGCLFKIEPLKASPLLKGYRNRCKFRIGKNTEGETTVGFCLNDNENKILGVQPGDKLIHLPDSMKYAAKKFEEFIRASGIEPYNKKQKNGYWHHIVIRIAPEGNLMMVVVTYHNHTSVEGFAEIKEKVREFFVNGDGKDCNLCSLYFQIMSEKAPMLSLDKLELLHGESHFYENICGLKFYVGPFSILNVNSSSSENVYKSIIELADPTPETVVLDLCSGTGGIAFTIADKCKNVIAIESQEDHINDALKTKEINNIQNVEFVKGKVEDELANVFEKIGDVPIIPIIDPPRQGLVQKAISQLRARESIKKLVYVCSNSKMGAKNFLDLCASADKKEGTFGNPLNVMFAGLPFLPVRAIPVDVCPHTVNNTIIILFERIDPSTFPPPKKPPPQPLKRPQAKLNDKRRRRNPRGRMRGGPAMGRDNRRFRMSFHGDQGKPFKKGPNQGGGRGGFHQSKAPPPLLRSSDPAMSLVAKYERRIAELEQQDRAFKAGLTMGLQALGSRGGPGAAAMNFDNFGTNFGPNPNENMPNYRNSILGNNPAWQRGGGGRNFDNSNFGGGVGVGGGGGGGGGSNFSGGFMGGGFNFNNGNNFGNFGGGGGGGPSGGKFVSGGFRSGGHGAGRGKGGDGGGGYRNFRGNKRRRQP